MLERFINLLSEVTEGPDMQYRLLHVIMQSSVGVSKITCALLQALMLIQLTGDEAQQAKQKEAVQECLEPMRQTLANNKWLGGNNINYADISVAGVFVVSPCPES